MRTFPFLLLISAACAGSGPGSSSAPAPASQTVRVVGPSGVAGTTMSATDNSSTHTLAVTPDQVWKLLPGVLDTLGIPVGTLEPASRTIGNSGLKIRGRLKGVPLSRYIDCGNSTQIGPNADSYDVNLVFLAEVRPAQGGSTVRVTLQAVAKPVNFAQDYSQCSTKGMLESRFFDILSARLKL